MLIAETENRSRRHVPVQVSGPVLDERDLLDALLLRFGDEVIDDIERGVLRQSDHGSSQPACDQSRLLKAHVRNALSRQLVS